MVYYLIKDDKIQNVIEADESMRATYEKMGYIFLVGSTAPGEPGIGWIHDGVKFARPPITD